MTAERVLNVLAGFDLIWNAQRRVSARPSMRPVPPARQIRPQPKTKKGNEDIFLDAGAPPTAPAIAEGGERMTWCPRARARPDTATTGGPDRHHCGSTHSTGPCLPQIVPACPLPAPVCPLTVPASTPPGQAQLCPCATRCQLEAATASRMPRAAPRARLGAAAPAAGSGFGLPTPALKCRSTGVQHRAPAGLHPPTSTSCVRPGHSVLARARPSSRTANAIWFDTTTPGWARCLRSGRSATKRACDGLGWSMHRPPVTLHVSFWRRGSRPLQSPGPGPVASVRRKAGGRAIVT